MESSTKESDTVSTTPILWVAEVTAWLKTMFETKVYSPSTFRLRATAFHQLASTIKSDESIDADTFLSHLHDFVQRYFHERGASKNTAAAYESRVRTLLKDFLQFKQNPENFKKTVHKPGRRAGLPKRNTESMDASHKIVSSSTHISKTGKQELDSSYGEIRSFPLDELGRKIVFQLPLTPLTTKEFLRFVSHLYPFWREFDFALQVKLIGDTERKKD